MEGIEATKWNGSTRYENVEDNICLDIKVLDKASLRSTELGTWCHSWQVYDPRSCIVEKKMGQLLPWNILKMPNKVVASVI